MCFKWVAQPPRHVRAVMRSLPFPFRLPGYVSLFRTPTYVNPPFLFQLIEINLLSAGAGSIISWVLSRRGMLIFGLFVYQGPKERKTLVCIDIQFQKVDVM